MLSQQRGFGTGAPVIRNPSPFGSTSLPRTLSAVSAGTPCKIGQALFKPFQVFVYIRFSLGTAGALSAGCPDCSLSQLLGACSSHETEDVACDQTAAHTRSRRHQPLPRFSARWCPWDRLLRRMPEQSLVQRGQEHLATLIILTTLNCLTLLCRSFSRS